MLRLLIEVPSVAGLGRRVVASATDLADSAPRNRMGPDGSDFIAVEWPVTQRLANGTVRDDYERLILIGVDTSRLSAEERERARDSLRELRPEVLQVFASIDWDDRGHSHAVEVASLSDFLDRPAFSRLPVLATPARSTAVVRDEYAPRVNRTWKWIGMAACLVGILCLMFWRRTPPPPPSAQAELTKAVSQAMSCSGDELKRWVAAARNIPHGDSAPEIDESTLNQLRNATSVQRFFVFDEVSSEQSQLGEFVELLSPSTAQDGEAIRKTLLSAYRHLMAMRASAADAGRCVGWKKAVESGDQSAQLPFIASLLDFGGEPLPKCSEDNVIGPFFGIDDHCRFNALAKFFTDDARRGALRMATGIDCQSGRQSKALWEAVSTMPKTDAELRRLATVFKLVYADTDCREFKDVVPHFSKVCQTLAGLLRDTESP